MLEKCPQMKSQAPTSLGGAVVWLLGVQSCWPSPGESPGELDRSRSAGIIPSSSSPSFALLTAAA